MAVPEMDAPKSQPVARLARRVEALERALRQNASTSRMLEAATIGKGGLRIVDAGVMELLGGGQVIARDGSIISLDQITRRAAQIFGGNLRLFPDYDDENWFARIYVDSEGDRLVLGAPRDPRTDVQTTFVSIRGARDSVAPGTLHVQAAEKASFWGKQVEINPTDGVFTIYNLPTTSGGYLLRYNEVGGQWTVALDSSSRRYKTSIEDVEIHPSDVLKWRPRRWKDINQGPSAPWNTGFIAEEVQEAGTPQFVIPDAQGRPDGIRKEILAVGHQVVLQDHEARIVAAEKRAAAAEARAAAAEKKAADLEIKVTGITAALKKLGINL